MVLLVIVSAAFVVALCRGGKLAHLGSLPLRWPAVPLLAFTIQSIFAYGPFPRGQGLWSLAGVFLLLSYLALLLSVWVNRRMPGMVLLGLGLVLNLTVMAANGGYMPITLEALQKIGYNECLAGSGAELDCSKGVILPQDQTRLWFLSDIIVLPHPFPLATAMSPGDLLVGLGAFFLVQYALLRPVPGEDHKIEKQAGAVDRRLDEPSRGGKHVSAAAEHPGGDSGGGPTVPRSASQWPEAGDDRAL